MVNLILILPNCRQPLPSWQGLLRPTSLPRPPWYEGAWPILGEARLAQEPQQLQSAGATTIHPSFCHPFTHPHINLAIHIFSTTHPSIHLLSAVQICPYLNFSKEKNPRRKRNVCTTMRATPGWRCWRTPTLSPSCSLGDENTVAADLRGGGFTTQTGESFLPFALLFLERENTNYV